METAGIRKLVLVVEDDPEQLTLMRLLLSGEGFDVVTEPQADRVLAGVEQLRPDVILLDVMLPSDLGYDGFRLCAEMRRLPSLAHTRIIIVSAIAEGVGEQRERLLAQSGADDYFVKPYDPSALVARIRQLTS